jgi:hypothetical protein
MYTWLDLIFQALVTVFAMILAGLLGWWVLDRDLPVVVKEVRAVTSVVPPGGTLKIQHLFHRKRLCHVHLEQVIFDSENVRFTVADEDYSTSPGRLGNDLFALQVAVPQTAAEGVAVYRGTRTYFCNPLHTWLDWPVVLIGPNVEFEIRRQ